MAGNTRKIYVGSPVFSHEDEERYHYVDTEVDGMSTGRTDEELELDTDGPSLSVSHDQKPSDQPGPHVQNSMLQDSLEGNPGDLTAVAQNKNGIVVVDPSRYEDLTMVVRDQRAVQQQGSGNGKANVVPRWVNVDAASHHYYLHDDAEEYEEAQLERQHQRWQARRAHVPHLELCHSDDEPSNSKAAFDLELTDGRVPCTVNSKKKVNRRVNFRALPRNSNSSDGNQLLDSLEYYPNSGVDDGNVGKAGYNKGHSYDDDCRSQPLDENNSADSYLHVYRNTRTGQHNQHSAVPDNSQANASSQTQSFSANKQQLSDHLLPPSNQVQVHQYSPAFQSQGQPSQISLNCKRQSDAAAVDFVEANRQNVTRKQQRSYGQIHSRKKGKENTVDSELSFQQRAADSVVSGQEVAERKPAVEPSGGQNEESDVMPSAEQLWQSRSQSLAARKESAESQPKNQRSAGKAGLAQNRVAPRPFLVPPQPTTAASQQQQQPNTQQHQLPTNGSFTIPVPTSDVPGKSALQKVSVDVNLNVVSPRPLLNQPSTSLPLQYTGASAAQHDVYQYSARTQAYTGAGQTQQAVQQQLPIRYNYSNPQSLAVSGGDALQLAVHPYQLQVCLSYCYWLQDLGLLNTNLMLIYALEAGENFGLFHGKIGYVMSDAIL